MHSVYAPILADNYLFLIKREQICGDDVKKQPAQICPAGRLKIMLISVIQTNF